MIDPLARFCARHAEALVQRSLFTMNLEELESTTKVSADEMRRWRDQGFLAFDPREVTAFDERHRVELEFVAAVVRSGLGDAWVESLLAQLRKPYCYDPNQTFYSFSHRRWVTLPPQKDTEELIDQYLAELADGENWSTLRELRDRIEDMLPHEEGDEQG